MGKVLQMFDGLRNVINGMGTSKDARISNTYAAPLPMSQAQIDAAYRGSGLMRKIISIPPLDMVREWRDWKLDAEEITKVENEEKRLGIRQKVRQAEVLRRLGGGALILGLPGDPTQPAPEGGDLAFVNLVSRWHLGYQRLNDDASDPGYGEPEMWQLSSTRGPVQIHPSRVITFRGDTAAAMIAIGAGSEDAYWGESEVAKVLDAVQDNDTARSAWANLMTKARLTRIGIPNLAEIASTADGETALTNRIRTMVLAENMFNASIYDAGGEEGKGGEKIDDVSYSFAGAKDVLNAYGEFAAAISDIPATRLLGRSPEGMNSSGESQQKDWNKKIRGMQELDLSPCLDKLDPYLIGSALGTVPDGQWYEWAPLDTPGEKERAETFKLETEAIEKLLMTGSIPDQAAAEAVQSWLIDRGYLPAAEAALLKIPEDERWGIMAEHGAEEMARLEAQLQQGDPLALAANDAKPRTLYVRRNLLNGAEFIAWAKSQGFDTTLDASDLHVTIAFSKVPVDWMQVGQDWHGDDSGELVIAPGGARMIETLGQNGEAVVLLFNSSALAWRHEAIREAGASWDWPEYQPHVTITYAKPEGLDLSSVEPFRGVLRFGPEIFEELDEDWRGKIKET